MNVLLFAFLSLILIFSAVQSSEAGYVDERKKYCYEQLPIYKEIGPTKFKKMFMSDPLLTNFCLSEYAKKNVPLKTTNYLPKATCDYWKPQKCAEYTVSNMHCVVLSDKKICQNLTSNKIFTTIIKSEHNGLENIKKSDNTSKIIPAWVKNNAGWWADGKINDNSFIQGIGFLVSDGIISIPPTTVSDNTSKIIPAWVKNNAGWWADGMISDDEFVNGVQHLIKNGSISVSVNTVMAPKTFSVDSFLRETQPYQKTPPDYRYYSNEDEYRPPTYTPPPPYTAPNLNIKESDSWQQALGQKKSLDHMKNYLDHMKNNPKIPLELTPKSIPKFDIPKSIPKFDIPKYAPDPFRDNPAIIKTPLPNPGRDTVLQEKYGFVP
jgi:hypothetical protein